MTDKQEFIVSELWILSWNASVQRANLYKASTKEKDRISFREKIITYISHEILPEYDSTVSEKEHEKKIQEISQQGTKYGSDILRPIGYKIGVAQKLLNLQLKYMWCLGVISEPPHCPVDRIMINKTELKDMVNWTEIVDIKTYRQVISAMKKAATPTGLKLAQWELDYYDRTDA